MSLPGESGMTKSFDCLGYGIAPVDILMRLDNYPEAGSKVDSRHTIIQGGRTAAPTLKQVQSFLKKGYRLYA